MSMATPPYYVDVATMQRDALLVLASVIEDWSPPDIRRLPDEFQVIDVDAALIAHMQHAPAEWILAIRNKHGNIKRLALLCIEILFNFITPDPTNEEKKRMFYAFMHNYVLDLLCGIMTPNAFIQMLEEVWRLF